MRKAMEQDMDMGTIQQVLKRSASCFPKVWWPVSGVPILRITFSILVGKSRVTSR